MLPHEMFNQSSTLRVVSLDIQETGTYNNQYMRPYVTDINNRTMNAVANVASEAMSRGKNISPLDMATVNNGAPIIAPSTQVDAMATIANGWQERRFRFFMVVDQHFHVGGIHRFYFTGYSTHVDSTYNNTLDPDMVFTINSMIRSRIVEAMTPMHGKVIQENVVSSRHLIANNNYAGAISTNQIYTIRPEDVYKYMQLDHIPDAGMNIINDTRVHAQKQASTSDTINGLPHNYASRIINTYMQASQVNPTYGDDNVDVYTDCLKLCTTMSSDNPLIVALAQIRDHGYISNNFTLRELNKLDPNADSVTRYAPLTAQDYNVIHTAGSTSDWHGQDPLTIAAFKIVHAMSGILGMVNVQAIMFTSTNSTSDMMFETKVNGASSLNNVGLPQRCQTFITRFENEVLRDITYNNQLSYFLEVSADVFGETRIKMSLNGSPLYEYVFPSFSDNLTSPIVTTNSNNLLQISSDFSSLLSDVGTSIQHTAELDLVGHHI